jgi:hypothetical protein
MAADYGLVIMVVSLTAGWIFGIRQTNSFWIRHNRRYLECRGKFYRVQETDGQD